jgi:hypothetical protein
MANLTPSEIKKEVRNVLLHAARGKGTRPNFLTAYQIFDRLPPDIKARLIAERGAIGGQHSGAQYTAASVVSQAAELLGPDVVIEYLDTQNLAVQVNGNTITPGNGVCAVYRLADSKAAQLIGSVSVLGDIVGPFHEDWQGAS